jgi:hypothetical protein
VFYTHRIAGPVYRFTTILDAMTRGYLGDRIKLRKNDNFENLGVSINGLADHYTDVFTELKAVAALIDENKSVAASSDVNEQIGKMNSILDRYQLDK